MNRISLDIETDSVLMDDLIEFEEILSYLFGPGEPNGSEKPDAPIRTDQELEEEMFIDHTNGDGKDEDVKYPDE